MHSNEHGWLCVSEDEAKLRVESTMFRRVQLRTRPPSGLETNGADKVVDVVVPRVAPGAPAWEAIQWGARFFFATDDPDVYVEGTTYMAPMVVVDEDGNAA